MRTIRISDLRKLVDQYKELAKDERRYEVRPTGPTRVSLEFDVGKPYLVSLLEDSSRRDMGIFLNGMILAAKQNAKEQTQS